MTLLANTYFNAEMHIQAEQVFRDKLQLLFDNEQNPKDAHITKALCDLSRSLPVWQRTDVKISKSEGIARRAVDMVYPEHDPLANTAKTRRKKISHGSHSQVQNPFECAPLLGRKQRYRSTHSLEGGFWQQYRSDDKIRKNED